MKQSPTQRAGFVLEIRQASQHAPSSSAHCPMKHALFFVLILALSHSAKAEPHQCTFETGAVVETEFPCEPARVERFGKRLIEIYPEVREINTSPDYIMGLYTFAMTSCTAQFAKMTPEEIGMNGEPFFPREMLAAMVKAGREVICPRPQSSSPTCNGSLR